MTLNGAAGAAGFSSSAADYAATMEPALAPIAAEVVRRAALKPGERVLDIGTGTGNAARLAVGEARTVTGLDAAAGMIEIARRRVPQASFVEADFGAIPVADGSMDVVLAVHALHFAGDRTQALAEWRRVTTEGGRLSVSVPGPASLAPIAIFRPVYERHGISWHDDLPSAPELADWAAGAGWADVEVEADPSTGIPLADEAAFRAWLRVGSRGHATRDWSDERREQLAGDLLAAAPRDGGAGYRLPFGTLFLTARNAP